MLALFQAGFSELLWGAGEIDMVENVIILLIYIAALVGLVYLAQWVLGRMGIEIPPMVMNVVWVIVTLIVLLLLWRALAPFIGGRGSLFPR